MAGQSEIEKACDMLYEKAETIDYSYDVHDRTVDGLLILPLYGSMPTGKAPKWSTERCLSKRHCELFFYFIYSFVLGMHSSS